ncbi:MAG TPA: cache domain-containing protein [Nitrososphaeraceae archaeon]|nr:cache domain-containing protein [Nitrososphaeraceae archaeon]
MHLTKPTAISIMLNIKTHRKKDSLILVSLISSSLSIVAFMTIASPGYINAVTSNTSNTTNNNKIVPNNLITNILAKNLENHLQKAGPILEITSKLPQVRNLPYAHLLNQTLKTLHGIPQQADVEKRQLAKNIISSNSGLYEIAFMMQNGDMYFSEPYSIQQSSVLNNYASRDYFQGTVKTNDTYLGNIIVTTSAAYGNREAVIAVPVYSSSKPTITGIWAGGIDFKMLDKEIQSLKLPSGERVVYTGDKGQKVADSDVNKSKTPESFANLNSFKSAINGKSGSVIDTVNNKMMLVTYQPVKAFHNTWVVLLMQPLSSAK